VLRQNLTLLPAKTLPRRDLLQEVKKPVNEGTNIVISIMAGFCYFRRPTSLPHGGPRHYLDIHPQPVPKS